MVAPLDNLEQHTQLLLLGPMGLLTPAPPAFATLARFH